MAGPFLPWEETRDGTWGEEVLRGALVALLINDNIVLYSSAYWLISCLVLIDWLID